MTETPVKFADKFILQEEVGRGAFAIVYKCTEISTNKQFAVKVIKKEKLSKRDLLKLESEAKILVKVSHPQIVRLHRVISEPKVHYFIFDLVTGGELFDDLVKQSESYTEELAAKCMAHIFEAVKFIHDKGVIHRDLKPENILLESTEKKTVKIADFGLAVEVENDEPHWYGMAGTPNYMAPEVLEMKPYGKPVDMWACGVIMYIILAGYQPFYHPIEKELYKLIKSGDYEMTSTSWKNVTAEGKDLITKLLCLSQTKRYTAVQALEHHWFRKVRGKKVLHRQDTLDQLKQFNAKRRFKAIVDSSLFIQKYFTAARKKREEESGKAKNSSFTSGPSV